MIYGYCRVSTRQQQIERQVRNIRNKYSNSIIVKEEYTGTSMERPVWKKLQSVVKSGDSIIFDEVSRMGRTASEGYKTYKMLYDKNINLEFLKEPHINTQVYREAYKGVIPMTGTIADSVLKGVNEMLLALAAEQIKLAFELAEKEVDYLHQRTKEGIETARLQGKQIGQKQGAKLNVYKAEPIEAIIEAKSRDFDGHNSDVEVMAILSQEKVSWIDQQGKKRSVNGRISRNTYYKYKKRVKEKRIN